MAFESFKIVKISLMIKITTKVLFFNHYFSPLYTFMRKGKDLDLYLLLIDSDDPGGPKT